MTTKANIEAAIIEALCTSGDLMPDDDATGICIDATGPSDGNTIRVFGWRDGPRRRNGFSATITVTLDQYHSDCDDDDDEDDDDDDDQ